MDLNSIMSTILSDDSIKGLGKKTGTSQKKVANVLSAALPSLINGAKGQADDDKTAESFAEALSDHAKDDTADLGSFLSGVDLEDGGKIVRHLLGDNTESETKTAAKSAGVSKSKAGNIISAAAPLLMSLIGQQFSSSSNNSSSGSSSGSSAVSGLMGNLIGNADIGSLIGNIVGNNNSSDSSGSSGFLGSVLGLFGRKK